MEIKGASKQGFTKGGLFVCLEWSIRTMSRLQSFAWYYGPEYA